MGQKGITRKIRKYLETNESEITTHTNLWDGGKALCFEENLSKEPQKEEQIKPKGSRGGKYSWLSVSEGFPSNHRLKQCFDQ